MSAIRQRANSATEGARSLWTQSAPARSRLDVAARAAQKRVEPITSRIAEPGWVVLALGVLCWIAGWLYGWQELMTVAAACVLIVAAAIGMTFGQANLQVRLEVSPQRVTAGDPAVARIFVRNEGTRQVLASDLEIPVGAQGVARFVPPSLGHGAEFSDIFSIPTQKRSIVRVGPVKSVRGDPLGIARREVNWCEPVDLYVHPRIERLPGVASGWMRDLEGTPTNELSPADIAFHTLREYVPGDDRRAIHWRSTARTGKLMVRQFVDTRRAHLGIVLSTRTADYASEDEFELAVSVCGSLGASVLANDQELSCFTDGTQIPTSARTHFMDGLSGIDLRANAEDLATAARRARRMLERASIAVVITGSQIDLDELQVASGWLPSQLRSLAVRVDPGSPAQSRVIRNLQVISLRQISDLAPRLHAMAVR